MKAYLDQCDSRYPLTNGAVFEFCGIRFRLRTNSEELFTYLRRFLDPFIAPVSPGGTAVRFDVQNGGRPSPIA